MNIAPFSFREFTGTEAIAATGKSSREFLPHGRKREEAPPPPPPPPVFSEEQMKMAERDGYQKGFLDGITEGKKQAESTQADIDRNLSEMVEQFSAHFAPLFGTYRSLLQIQAAQLPKMAHAIAKKVAGDMLMKDSAPLIEEICLRCVQTMLHEPKLTITIHDSMQQTLEKKIRETAAKLQIPSEIQVVGDAHIAPPNCRIEWKNGAMVRDTDSLWQQVEQVVANMIASGEREANAICDAMENPQPTAPVTATGT